jgi:glycosyltransferase involved in cell wall biosynthesis
VELRVKSVRFLGRRSYEQLPTEMAASHVCLGIFGTSPKAQRVIPNKVFDALAVARPVITGDTRAVREVLTHGENAWLCPPGDPEALAEAVLALRSDAAARLQLAHRGHELFRQRFSIDALSRDVATIVLEVLGPSSSARLRVPR